MLVLLLLPTEYTNELNQPVEFSWAGRATLAMLIWMAVWWLTESFDLAVTSLLPVVMFPLLGIASMKEATASYANPMIFLFIGGFILALAMQRWGVDQRLALVVLKRVGTRPAAMVAGFMLVTAGLSAFISNTATTAMMLPIALSVISLVGHSDHASGRNRPKKSNSPTSDQLQRNFAVCLLLGIAYAASIGGVATIIGTPPNVFLIGFLKDSIDPVYRVDISFVQWLKIGLPFTVIFLPLTWLLLTSLVFQIPAGEIPGSKLLVDQHYKKLGSITADQWATGAVFCLTAMGWMTRSLWCEWRITWNNVEFQPFVKLTDEWIAMIGAFLLFLVPARGIPMAISKSVAPVAPYRPTFLMDWKTAERLPWGILMLFGGGLSLAAAIQRNGVSEFFGAQARFIANIPEFWIVLLVCLAVVYFTEVTSNIATTATLLPILAAIAPALNIHPYLLVIPTAIASSCAFMLPIATAPNAIIFGSGEVEISDMLKAGFWLNILSVVLSVAFAFGVVKPIMGI